MVPRQPHETPAIGAQARRRVEVVARDEHTLLSAFEVYADYLVYGFVPGVVLPHGDKAPAVPIHHHVRESSARLRSERHRLVARGQAIDPLVGEVREVDRVPVDGETTATVFVHPRACVERLRRNVLGSSVRCQEHDDVAPALAGAALKPVHVPTIDHDFLQPHYPPDDHIRGDRGPPGTVGRDSTFGHSSAALPFGLSQSEDSKTSHEPLRPSLIVSPPLRGTTLTSRSPARTKSSSVSSNSVRCRTKTTRCCIVSSSMDSRRASSAPTASASNRSRSAASAHRRPRLASASACSADSRLRHSSTCSSLRFSIRSMADARCLPITSRLYSCARVLLTLPRFRPPSGRRGGYYASPDSASSSLLTTRTGPWA